MHTSASVERSLTIQLETHYLLRAPSPVPERPLLVVAAHGYAMNPSVMLELCQSVVSPHVLIASLEAPNQHYLTTKPGSEEIGFNWGTRARWRTAIAAHHEMVLGVLEQCREEFGITPDRSLLLGFSQPVGLNYRFAATYPEAIGGVIGICGGVPRDWEQDGYQAVTAALLHIARDQDEYYPPEVAKQFAGRLRHRAAEVEFHLLSGPHRFPSSAGAIIQPWMRRVFPTAAL
ncbi:MAG: hypothetical protein FJW20_18285 [Acidimicrobiia bacterium]|nr:hypothetical protein [Acidimicrobiia bacterium]